MLAQLGDTIDILAIVHGLVDDGSEDARMQAMTLLSVYSASLEAKRNALL